jgi:hypothetical protein
MTFLGLEALGSSRSLEKVEDLWNRCTVCCVAYTIDNMIVASIYQLWWGSFWWVAAVEAVFMHAGDSGLQAFWISQF